jgi:transcriptional regulator with XRE-family HTH domain
MRTDTNDRLGGSGVAINGPVLRAWRQIRGFSAADLAEAVSRHRSFISKLETGAAHRVSPRVFRRLLDVLEIDDPFVLMRAPARPDEPAADIPAQERASA